MTDGRGNSPLSPSPTMEFSTEFTDYDGNLLVAPVLGEGGSATTTFFSSDDEIEGWEDFQGAKTVYTMSREYTVGISPFSESTLDLFVETSLDASSKWVSSPEDFAHYSFSDFGDTFSVSVTSPTPGITVRLVPEPSSLAVVLLWGTFFAGVGWWRRRQAALRNR